MHQKVSIKQTSHEMNPYMKQLHEIAKITEYQSVASIPQQSKDFIYTINKANQEMFGNRRVKKKVKDDEKANFFKEIDMSSNKIKLTTILQDGDNKKQMILPRIQHNSNKEQKLNKFKNSLKRDSSIERNLRQKNKTIDTRVETEEQKSLNLGDLIQNSKIKLIPLRHDMPFSPTTDNSVTHSHSPQKNSRYQVSVQQILPQNDDDSQSETQYQKDSVPGPGSYSYSYSQFDKSKEKASRSTNASSFMSKASRFQSVKMKNPQESPQVLEKKRIYLSNLKRREQQLQQLRRLKVKKRVPFNAEEPRRFEHQLRQDKSPGPMDYSPRLGIEEDLIHQIQRNFKGNFGSYEKRFFNPFKDSSDLGPGQYNSLNKSTIQENNGSHFFVSKQDRFQLK